MSTHRMRRAVPKFAAASREDSTDAEIIAAWRGYVGYFGRYTVDEKAQTVNHRFEGDRLILQADSASGRTTIMWKRSLK